MTAPSNKPRDIKDLKARLGRTVTPGTPGASAPPMGPPGASVPPPAVGGAPPGAPLRSPLSGAPFPGAPGSIPAPPFAQPGARPMGQAPMPGRMPMPGAPVPAPGPMSARPPAVGAPAGRGPLDVMAPSAVVEKKVRLVIDDSAVKDSEIGRKNATRNIVLVVIGALLGIAFGFGIGSVKADRNQYNMAIRDGKDIYKKIDEVSKKLDTARLKVREALEASQGGPGRQAKANYAAIETLVAMERPFGAGEFSRRRYLAFPTPVVDDLFEYYNNINLLWDKFGALGNKTSGQAARSALDKSAAAADELIASEYGLVIAKAGDDFVGGVVVVKRKPEGDEPAAEDKKGKGKKGEKAEDEKKPGVIMLVSSREGGQEVERTLFTGQEDFLEKYGDYVIGVDKARSMKTLGTSANLFGQYRADVAELSGIMDKTAEIQGRLIKELGKINMLEETGLF